MQNELAGYSLQLARTVGRFEGLTEFLVKESNTMTKEEIVAWMAEIVQEFNEATKKPSRQQEVEREEFYSHLG
jgi:hypothetical protein